MKTLRPVRLCATLSMLTALTLVVVGCGRQEMEKASDAAKQVAEDAEQTAVEAASATGEAAKDATDAVGQAAKEATEAVSEGFAAAADKAAKALEGIEGGGELLTGIKDFFKSAEESLRGITDKASAEAALSKLDELGASVDKLGESAAKLPGEAMSAIGGVVEQGMAQLKALVDKLMATPEIQEVLKPKLDELMEKLRKLAGGEGA